MRKNPRLIFVLLVPFWLTACKHPMVREDQPARIVNPDEKSRAELRNAVSEALHNVPVELAGDALTKDDRLIIERKQHRDASGNVIMGYETEMPREFRLVKSGDNCFLVDMASKKRKQLKQTACETVQ